LFAVVGRQRSRGTAAELVCEKNGGLAWVREVVQNCRNSWRCVSLGRELEKGEKNCVDERD
jgi:hypothetical protein